MCVCINLKYVLYRECECVCVNVFRCTCYPILKTIIKHHFSIFLTASTMAGMGPIPILSTTILSDHIHVYVHTISPCSHDCRRRFRGM